MPDGSAVDHGAVQTQHPKFIGNIDPDDPEYRRQLMRPAAIKEDVNLMTQKRRVSLILKSDCFRQELEEIMRSQAQAGDFPGLSTSLLSLQHISDLFTSAPIGVSPNTTGLNKVQHTGIIPINDIRGGDSGIYSRRERTLRCKLASVYRLIDLFGWNTGIHNHVSARVGSNEHFLVNPFGLLYHEITASSLIKVDLKGQILDPGSTILGVNQNTWWLRSAVHAARCDIRCIIHVDTPATIAVSCMKSGFLPLCPEAMILGEVAYYTALRHNATTSNEQLEFGHAFAEWDAERLAISEALGPSARVMFMRGRGLLALGESVEEAWHYATNAVVACETQLLLAPLGVENLVMPSDKLKQQTYGTWRTSGLGGLTGPEAALAVRLSVEHRSSAAEGGYSSDGDVVTSPIIRPWRLGELEFEAMMRHLDNAGCRTGHLYRQENVTSPHHASRARTLDRQMHVGEDGDIRIPPTASSATATMSYYYEDGVLSGDETETPHPSSLRRDHSKRMLYNTPNKYSKELIKFSPEQQPISRWVSERESAIRKAVKAGACPPPAPFHPLTPGAVPLGRTGAPATGTASAYGPYNSFAPQGQDPKELRDHQRKVKAKYYHDTNTAGPQSRLLDELTVDEVRRVRDEGLVKFLGPNHAALVSRRAGVPPVEAASKAIIQREARNEAVIHDSLYTHQNPFEKITDEELEMYRREIELKNNPELAAELERRHILETMSVPITVDTGTTDDAGSAIEAAPPLSGTLTSEQSATEDTTEVSTRGKKKKKRFKLPSFSLRHKDKLKEK